MLTIAGGIVLGWLAVCAIRMALCILAVIPAAYNDKPSSGEILAEFTDEG